MIHINHKEKCLVDSETGKIYRHSCWSDLIQYHSYLMSSKERSNQAQRLLSDAMEGKKVITNMVAYFSENKNKFKG